MFCDVDQVDIVYERASDGAKIGVQTDHRPAEALAADLARSLVFTVARVVRPLATDPGLTAVEYVFPQMPPAELRRAVEAAGARLRVGDELVDRSRSPTTRSRTSSRPRRWSRSARPR